MSKDGGDEIKESKQNGTPEEPEESTAYPPVLDYLQTKEGHELASRLVAVIEAIQKATIDTSAKQREQELEFHHSTVRLWLKLQVGIFSLVIVAAVGLAWHSKLDATVAALMGTMFGYFLGRPLN